MTIPSGAPLSVKVRTTSSESNRLARGILSGLRPYTRNIQTNIYLAAARGVGLRVEVVDPGLAIARIYDNTNELFVRWAELDCNSKLFCDFSNQKPFTHKRLSEAGLPIPEFAVFARQTQRRVRFDLDAILAFASDKYPVAIKPVDGSGSRGVIAPIESENELQQLIANEWNEPFVLVERYIAGRHYRVLMFRNRVVDIVERIPAFVVGDGRHTVRALIEQKTAYRVSHALRPIPLSTPTQRFLGKQHLDFDTKPAEGERVQLSDSCGLNAGGETSRIDAAKLDPALRKLFGDASRVGRLTLVGLDFICSDIYERDAVVHGMFNEINSAPGMMIHYYADMRGSLNAPKKILGDYFGLTNLAKAARE